MTSSRRLQLAIFAAVIGIAAVTLPRLSRPTDVLHYGDIVGGGWSQAMASRTVDVLFIGNSTLQWGVDVGAFERRTGRLAQALWMPGSAGGWWYLALERVVARAEHPPKLVVICFNDDALTLTVLIQDQRGLDRAVRMLDEEDRQSGAMARLADSGHSPTIAYIDRRWPLVAVRGDARQHVEGAVLGYVGWIAGGSAQTVEDSMARVFALERKDAQQLDGTANPEAFDPRLLDFARMRDRSFLLDLLDSAEKNRIPLLFARMPRKATTYRRDSEREAALRRYIDDLGALLAERGHPFLDFSTLEGLDPERDFEAGDHLSESGRAAFMPVLTNALEPYLPPPSLVANR